jgi:UTP--glucose-1-phosphate uridylyltransferase
MSSTRRGRRHRAFRLRHRPQQGVIEDHFDIAYELDDTLRSAARPRILADLLADLPAAGQTSFTRQQAPLGLGHAVWCARDIIGDEPFAVILPDMLHAMAANTAAWPR